MIRAERIVGDVSGLPDHNFGSASLGRWCVNGFMLIQGVGFVLMIGVYFHLLPHERSWSLQEPPPSLPWASLLTALAITSEIPNDWIKQRARRYELRAVQTGLALMTLIGVAMLVLRALEFTALDVRWDTNAYGSIVWVLLALHTVYMATDVFDSGMLAVMSFRKQMTGRRLADVTDNAIYWHFIVWSWVALYVVIYWAPR